MDVVGLFTSINPFIIGILMVVLVAGAYTKWASH